MTSTVELSGHVLTKGQMVATCWSQLVMLLQFWADTTTGDWETCRIHVKERCDSCSATFTVLGLCSRVATFPVQMRARSCCFAPCTQGSSQVSMLQCRIGWNGLLSSSQ